MTVQGPVKEQQPDGLSHRGSIEPPKSGWGLGKGLTVRSRQLSPFWGRGGGLARGLYRPLPPLKCQPRCPLYAAFRWSAHVHGASWESKGKGSCGHMRGPKKRPTGQRVRASPRSKRGAVCGGGASGLAAAKGPADLTHECPRGTGPPHRRCCGVLRRGRRLHIDGAMASKGHRALCLSGEPCVPNRLQYTGFLERCGAQQTLVWGVVPVLRRRRT